MANNLTTVAHPRFVSRAVFFAYLRDDPRFQALIDRMAEHVAAQLAQAEADGSLAIIDAISAGVSPQTFLERR